ncbi:MAG: EAL domain-containing protein [Peptostreptococcaceae bacterium]|nr:EAL domain-containing protein [Peptostreptococcaceae bacterium]
MDVYLARQPIYDATRKLSAYELLYRADENNRFAAGVDGDEATSILVSDAITIFGINNITNGNLAYINFTKKLIMDDFAMLLSPEEVVIEILEDTIIDDQIIEKLAELKNKNYTIALDDYTGDPQYDSIMNYVDIIKVDFSEITQEKAVEIAKTYSEKGKLMLAEKIETEEEFLIAIQSGYKLFQGYYFSKPNMMKKSSVKLDASGYATIIAELGRFEPDFQSLSGAIRTNPNLTYKLFQYVNTLKFSQKQKVTSIQMALVTMGLNEVRRWILLIMAREFCKDKQDELVKTSFVRGVFAEKLAQRRPSLSGRSHEAFLMGIFSMMDAIAGQSLEDILKQIPLDDDIKSALGGYDNEFGELLEFVENYERANWDKIYKELRKYNLDRESTLRLYLECVVYADLLFNNDPTLTS